MQIVSNIRESNNEKIERRVGTKTEIFVENIPQCLKDEPRWVVWKYEDRNGKPTKVPYCPRRYRSASGLPVVLKGSSNNPETWSTIQLAIQTYNCIPDVGGIGFMLGGGWVGWDFDHCYIGTSLSFEAECDYRHFASYAEISPSGSGIKGICRGHLPLNGDGVEGGRRAGQREFYSEGRFFTTTGRLYGQYKDVFERQPAIDQHYKKHWGEPSKPSAASHPAVVSTVEDQKILEIAFGAANGDTTRAVYEADETAIMERGMVKAEGGPDWSAAVFGLLGRLACYTQDPDQLDRLFRASALYPYWESKWEDRRDKEIQK